jgi:bacterioferritin-associated ferredoxin
MVVCSCRAVSDRTIRAAIAAGASTVPELTARCAAASGCRGCCPALERLLAEHANPPPVGAAITCPERVRS